jgi:hypothetical protein
MWAADIGAALVSLYFFWQHDLVVGLLIHLIPPPIGSFAVVRFANLEGYKNSQLGAYLLRYMTPTAQATRLLGNIVIVVGAWYHLPIGIATGIAIVVAAWTYGLLLQPTRS